VKKHLKAASNVRRTVTSARGRFPRLSLATVVVAIVILAIGAITVVSRQKARATSNGQDNRPQMAEKSQQNFVKLNVAGQDVQVDGDTGRIRELTPEEAQKLAAGFKGMVNQSTEGLVQVHHPDGSVSMDLEGRFQNVTVARRDKDGSITQSCVDNPKAAGEFFGIDPKLLEPDRSAPAGRTKTRNQN
jgi:hypothetical protein